MYNLTGNIRYSTDGRGVPAISTSSLGGTGGGGVPDSALNQQSNLFTFANGGFSGPVFSISKIALLSAGSNSSIIGGLLASDTGALDDVFGLFNEGSTADDVTEMVDDTYEIESNQYIAHLLGDNALLYGVNPANPGSIFSDNSRLNSGSIEELRNKIDSYMIFKLLDNAQINHGFKDLGLGYNPLATMVLGVTFDPNLGHTPGFRLGSTASLRSVATGATSEVTGKVVQILDLTGIAPTGTTHVPGINGSLTGGVYALFMSEVGPTGGTASRGITIFTSGYTLEGNGVTGTVSYANIIDNDDKNSLLSTIADYVDLNLCNIALSVTGGSAGSTSYIDIAGNQGSTLGTLDANKSFEIGVRPNMIDDLIMYCRNQSESISKSNKYHDIIKHIMVPNGVTGQGPSGIMDGEKTTNTRIYTDKLSSSISSPGATGATMPQSGAFPILDSAVYKTALDELIYTLSVDYRTTLSSARDSVMAGATQQDTFYKLEQFFDTTIKSRLEIL
jgi:hypothetical protein